MPGNKGQTYDLICFTALAYEFGFSDKNDIEKKIRRRLKYYKLGDYNQERVNYIRQIKNDLSVEIASGAKSKYFHQSKCNYADLSDFDFDRITSDYIIKYNKIDEMELKEMVNFAIYLYHIR